MRNNAYKILSFGTEAYRRLLTYYQAALVCKLLEWNYEKHCSKGAGMYGRCKAFMRGDEEQGLHGCSLVWIGGI